MSLLLFFTGGGRSPQVGRGPQVGGKKVPSWTEAVLYEQMAHESQHKEGDGRRLRARVLQEESRRIKAETFGKIRKSAAIAVLLAEI